MQSVNRESADASETLIEENLFASENATENLSPNETTSQLKGHLSEELLENEGANRKNSLVLIRLRGVVKFMGAHFLKTLFAISLIFVYLEYTQSLKQQKISNSFEMVKDWERQGTAEDYAIFSQRVQRLSEKGSTLLDQTESVDDEKILVANYVKSNLFKDISAAEEKAIGNVLYYFNKVGLCIDSELCETKFLIEFFGDSVRVFWFYYRDQALYRRDILSFKNHAEYTERFALEIN